MVERQHDWKFWMNPLNRCSCALRRGNNRFGPSCSARTLAEVLRTPRMLHLLESSPGGRRFVSRTESLEEVPERNEGRSDVDLRSDALTEATGNPAAHDSRFVPAIMAAQKDGEF